MPYVMKEVYDELVSRVDHLEEFAMTVFLQLNVCAKCTKPAVVFDSFYPYFTDGNRCRPHFAKEYKSMESVTEPGAPPP